MTRLRLLRAFSPVARRYSAHRDRIDTDHLKLLLSFALQRDSNCIDVGANRGVVLRHMVTVAPEGKHIAFEPLPNLHEFLVKTFPQVDVRQVALSDVIGQSEFHHVRNFPGYSGLRERRYPAAADAVGIQVETDTLSNQIPPDYAPSLIKIDVEGAEGHVIRGALDVITRYQPIVVFEHGLGGANYYDVSSKEIYDMLCGHAGLKIFDIDGKGPLSPVAFQKSYEQGALWNYVAHR